MNHCMFIAASNRNLASQYHWHIECFAVAMPAWAEGIQIYLATDAIRSEQIRGSIVVSISACHAEDPGSIPGRGV